MYIFSIKMLPVVFGLMGSFGIDRRSFSTVCRSFSALWDRSVLTGGRFDRLETSSSTLTASIITLTASSSPLRASSALSCPVDCPVLLTVLSYGYPILSSPLDCPYLLTVLLCQLPCPVNCPVDCPVLCTVLSF